MNTDDKAAAYDDMTIATKNRLLGLITGINSILNTAEKAAKAGYFDECAQELEKIKELISNELNPYFYTMIDYF